MVALPPPWTSWSSFQPDHCFPPHIHTHHTDNAITVCPLPTIALLASPQHALSLGGPLIEGTTSLIGLGGPTVEATLKVRFCMMNADDVKRWQGGDFEDGRGQWNEHIKMSFAKALGADFAAQASKLQE